MPLHTPLHAVHCELHVSFVEFAGWTMPLRYAGEAAEHRAVRERAGLFDLSHMGQIEVTGEDAAAALDHALVGHLSRVRIGRAKYTMLCRPDGGILDDLVVYRLTENRYLVVANAANATTVHSELCARSAGLAVDVLDRAGRSALIAVQGPYAAAIVAAVAGHGVEDIPYYGVAAVTAAGCHAFAARTGYTGEDGFELFCDAADATDIWHAVSAAGTEYGLQPAGLACRDTLRLEAGMPLYGHELHVDVTPFEAGLTRVVNFDKPDDFVGRSALAARKEAGWTTTLVGLIAHGRRVSRQGHDVIDPAGAAKVGTITSGAPSPTLGHPIAMAYVPTGLAEPGTQLKVDVRGHREPVEVTPLPFYRRNGGQPVT